MYAKDLIILFIIFIGLLFTYFNLLIFYASDDKKKKNMRDLPKVSIIVPAYNEEKNIENTIKSLLSLDYPRDKLEIIVVDDGSKDRTYEVARKYESDVLKVYRKENGGKASALNYGIKRASGEFIVTMDADSVVPKDALKKMLEYFDEDVMIVVPAIQITKVNNFWEHLQVIEYSYNNFLRLIFDKLNSIYVAPGPFSVFRRDFFERVGYFDEGNITEDMEIAMRCQAYGYKIRYCPEVVVKTKAPSSFRSLLKQRLRWYLGFIDNFLVYRNRIVNKVLVNIVFGGAILFIIIPLVNLGIFAYDIVKSVYNSLVFYSSIDFNVLPLIRQGLFDWQSSFSYIKLDYLSRGIFYMFYNIVLILTFLIFIKKAWMIEKVDSSYRRILSLLVYSFFYIFFYSVVWFIVILYKVFGRELRWGGVRWENSLINRIWR
ncbi:MAG: hypothetical protein BXU00_00825 [Candidatus Nanoclepta minutus]|uniref:Glycosyltransferase 2-like domain-containing protein n=1 Tax=Candidatus Nanoclepta minutus TaxID=1940235 RepID=A0A397WNI0_9ARCH|nr:MAG: hypothetical protein BXU00_00825 [Candidatus Nanoclepta minutus]